MEYTWLVAHNTISLFVPEVCTAIYEVYREELFSLPTTHDGWKEKASKFSKRWNFHNCVGAIDGKHIRIKKPPNSGSLYWNYKSFYSIILLAVVDGSYSFLWASVGAEGSASDAGVFNRSTLRPALENNLLPPPQPIPGDDRPMPFFIVGDDAFPLRTWLMKPFANRGLTHRETEDLQL